MIYDYVTFKAEDTHYRVISQFTSSELKVSQIGAIVPSNTLLTAIKVLKKIKIHNVSYKQYALLGSR